MVVDFEWLDFYFISLSVWSYVLVLLSHLVMQEVCRSPLGLLHHIQLLCYFWVITCQSMLVGPVSFLFTMVIVFLVVRSFDVIFLVLIGCA